MTSRHIKRMNGLITTLTPSTRTDTSNELIRFRIEHIRTASRIRDIYFPIRASHAVWLPRKGLFLISVHPLNHTFHMTHITGRYIKDLQTIMSRSVISVTYMHSHKDGLLSDEKFPQWHWNIQARKV